MQKNGMLIGFSISLIFIMMVPAMAWDLGGALEEWDTSPYRPYDITVLNDGTPWLTYHDEVADDWPTGRVFTIDPSNGAVTAYDVPTAWGDSGFQMLDHAPDNTLWIADTYDRIAHFNPTTHVFTEHLLPAADFTLPAGPLGIKVASDGKVWFTCMTSNEVGYYDPNTNTWDAFTVDDGGNSGKPVDIAFTDDGMVWFTTKSGGDISGLGSLDPGTGVVTLRAIDGGVDPFGIAVAPGRIWFLDHHRTANGTLVRYDIAGNAFTYYEGIPELKDPHLLLIDPDGVIWFTSLGSSAIGTFNPLTTTFESRAVAESSLPMGIAMYPAGNQIWWAETFNSGHGGAGRITQATPPAPIPTVTEWGIILFSCILAGLSLWMIRRRNAMA